MMNRKNMYAPGYDYPYSTIAVDLTTAHTDLRITVQNPVRFIQFWTDGGLQGISVKLEATGNAALKLEQMRTIPINQTYHDLYITNDVRQGRSTLVVYFVRQDTPLELGYGGQDISLSELAVRNGTIHSFDRRGEILFMDDFENGMKWDVSFAGNYGGVALTTASKRSGQTSAKLITGDAIGDTADIIKRLHYPRLTSMGFEISFTNEWNLSSYLTQLYLCESAKFYSPAVRFVPNTAVDKNGDLEYRTSLAGAWVSLASDLFVNDSPNEWNTMKFAVDFNKKLFKYAVFNERVFDLSNIPLVSGNTNDYYYLSAMFKITTKVNSNQFCYADDAIVTHNEL